MSVLGRPRAFDRDAALQAAMLVFWRKGFLGTSMNDLCEAMDIRSPSLYAAFGSKEKLYAEAVDRYSAASHALIWSHIDDGPTVRAGMQKVLLAAARVMAGRDETPSGCLVTFATAEEYAGATSDSARKTRQDWLGTLRKALRRAMAAGEIPRSTPIDNLSRFYVSVVQGMAVQARDGASVAQLEGLARTAMAAWPGV
jgi:AcrR family transcriptional regulator